MNSNFRRYCPIILFTRLTTVVKVLVVDDQPLMRSSLECYIHKADGVELVGSAENGVTALKAVDALRPDVVLMDLQMPVMNGIDATVRLTRQYPGVRVLAITTYGAEQSREAAVDAGAAGCIPKDAEPADIVAAIQQVHGCFSRAGTA